MMHRRSLLTMLGLGALAPVLPTIPAVAKPAIDPRAAAALALEAEFQDPLYAIAFVEGPRGERYRYHMPATLRYFKWPQLVVEFTASFTGTVRSVEIARGDVNLVTLYRDALDTPNWVSGMLVRVSISASSNPSEEA